MPWYRIGASICSVTDPVEPAENAASEDPGAAGFVALGLDERLLRTLAALGYEEPTPVQRRGDPALLVGQRRARRGADRHRQDRGLRAADPPAAAAASDDARDGTAAALVLVPTRELAMQVAEAIHQYGKELGVRVLPVYGGQPIGQQLRGLPAASTSSSRRPAARSTT